MLFSVVWILHLDFLKTGIQEILQIKLLFQLHPVFPLLRGRVFSAMSQKSWFPSPLSSPSFFECVWLPWMDGCRSCQQRWHQHAGCDHGMTCTPPTPMLPAAQGAPCWSHMSCIECHPPPSTLALFPGNRLGTQQRASLSCPVTYSNYSSLFKSCMFWSFVLTFHYFVSRFSGCRATTFLGVLYLCGLWVSPVLRICSRKGWWQVLLEERALLMSC